MKMRHSFVIWRKRSIVMASPQCLHAMAERRFRSCTEIAIFWRQFSLAILMLAGFAQVLVSAQGQGENEQGLVGSWNVVVSLRDCDTGTVLASFPGINTFNQGGTMQQTAFPNLGLLHCLVTATGVIKQGEFTPLPFNSSRLILTAILPERLL